MPVMVTRRFPEQADKTALEFLITGITGGIFSLNPSRGDIEG
ncbi:UNVERIFIED_ORG: hypothetical protein J2Y78_004845 [Buttiauxella agrestis ATCC 33320]